MASRCRALPQLPWHFHTRRIEDSIHSPWLTGAHNWQVIPNDPSPSLLLPYYDKYHDSSDVKAHPSKAQIKSSHGPTWIFQGEILMYWRGIIDPPWPHHCVLTRAIFQSLHFPHSGPPVLTSVHSTFKPQGCTGPPCTVAVARPPHSLLSPHLLSLLKLRPHPRRPLAGRDELFFKVTITLP